MRSVNGYALDSHVCVNGGRFIWHLWFGFPVTENNGELGLLSTLKSTDEIVLQQCNEPEVTG
jgi:hypothetical protein